MGQRGKRLAPGQSYAGRREDVSVINLSMLREDVESHQALQWRQTMWRLYCWAGP